METKPYQILKEMREKLREPFPIEAYQAHSSKSFLTTIKAMYIIERLNDVFGIGRWTLEHEVINSENGYILMKGQLRLSDYPDIIVPTQYGGHKTSGTGTEMADGYKSAITDCITKSASYLEIGINVFKGLVKPPKSTKKETEKSDKRDEYPKFKSDEKPWLNQSAESESPWQKAIIFLKDGGLIDKIDKDYRMSKANRQNLIDAAL